jgi:predicted dehydrogenase
MEKLKIGIIGIGRMGMTHYSIMNSHPTVAVVAIADPSAFVLNLMKQYMQGIRAYAEYEEVFENETLDAVLVCTPPAMHYAIAKKAGEKGIHVFSEKPFTAKVKLADELAIQFKEKCLVNQVGYVNRFNDVFRTVRDYIRDGVVGDVIRFKSEMYSGTITKPEEGKTWRDSRESGGGALLEVASHAIDLVNYIVGKPDRVTGSSLTQIYSKHVEDAINATFLYKNGIAGTLSVNWSDASYRKPTNKIEVFGSRGKLLADQHGFKIFLNKELPDRHLRQGWNTRYITDVFKPVPFYVRGNEFTCQLYHFIDCIGDRQIRNQCSFRDATNVLEVTEAIVADYEQNGRF